MKCLEMMEILPERSWQGCSEEALDGSSHCRLHTTERLANARKWQEEHLAQLKETAGALIELDLQIVRLREQKEVSRQKVLGLRREIESLSEALEGS